MGLVAGEMNQLRLFRLKCGAARLAPLFDHGYDFAPYLVDVPTRHGARDPGREIINESHLSRGARASSGYQVCIVKQE